MDVFYPGDKVRFLNEDGDGVVVAVDGKNVLVKTPDGFEIPYPASHLVRFSVSSQKAKVVYEVEKPTAEALGDYGLYFAYVPVGEQLLSLRFINRTSFSVAFVMCEMVDGDWKGRKEGILPSGAHTEVIKRTIAQLGKWPDMSAMILYMGEGKVIPEPRTFKHVVSPKSFFDQKQLAPLIEKDAYLYQIDNHEWQKHQEHLKGKLKKAFSGTEPEEEKEKVLEWVPDVIDLHLEAIPDAPRNLGVKNVLGFQMEYAEKMLDKAIAAGLSKVTFIHGAGDGVLKREIQQLGRQHPHVSSFGKGDPNKYGAGATFLKIQ